MPGPLPRVVIVGGGFAGLAVARALRDAPCDVTLVDRRNHHLFQPLLYQVATASLSATDVAAPIRKVLSRQRNTRVLLGEAVRVDAARKVLVLKDAEMGYDVLVLAAGVTHSYFGRPEWSEHAPGLKSLEDALEIRRRFLLAFEAAERTDDPTMRRANLTFVIVGAGPTGVELAGSIAEVARRAIPRDFRAIDTKTARVILVQSDDRVLPTFHAELPARARRDLEALGVEVRVNSRVTDVDPDGVLINGSERVDAECVLWAAGVEAEALVRSLGVELHRSGRVPVGPDLGVAGCQDVYVIGDLAVVTDPKTGQPVPGVAPAAAQMGRHLGRTLRRRFVAASRGEPIPASPPFRYVDKGTLATIGRARAVAVIRGVRVAGLAAWLLWALVHILFLIGFRNKLLVMIQWAWAYVLFQRGARIITGPTDLQLRRHSSHEAQPQAGKAASDQDAHAAHEPATSLRP